MLLLLLLLLKRMLLLLGPCKGLGLRGSGLEHDPSTSPAPCAGEDRPVDLLLGVEKGAA